MDTVAEKTAKILLKTKCVEFSLETPFTYASGATGPLYCDNRHLLGFPGEREDLVDLLVKKIQRECPSFDVLAGVATGAIAYAAMVAFRLGRPMVYVRPSEKDYGKKNQIEGHFVPGWRALVLEDLVNRGSSLEAAIGALRRGNLTVSSCLSVVDYERKEAQERLTKLKVQHFSLTRFTTILSEAPLSQLQKQQVRSSHF